MKPTVARFVPKKIDTDVNVIKKKKKKKNSSKLTFYVNKLLKEKNSDMSIQGLIARSIGNLLEDIIDDIVKEADGLVADRKQITMSHKNIEYASRIYLHDSPALAENANEYALNALEKYKESQQIKDSIEN